MDEDEEIDSEQAQTGNEVTCVGAGLGGGFQHTTELTMKKYNQVMHGTQKQEWAKEVVKEHWRMPINSVWMPMLRSKLKI